MKIPVGDAVANSPDLADACQNPASDPLVDQQGETGDDIEEIGENGGRQDFFDALWVRKIQVRIDIWAAVKKARAWEGQGTTPTLESIMGLSGPKMDPDSKIAKLQKGKYLHLGVDSTVGRWVKDLEIYIPSATRRQVNPIQLTYLAVDEAISLYAKKYELALLSIHPRYGKYAPDPKWLAERSSEEIRADRAVAKAVIRLLDGRIGV